MSRYNANVRVGNWFDEMVMQEEILKKYLGEKAQHALQVQRVRMYFEGVLQEVELDKSGDEVVYGATVQVLAPFTPNTLKGMSDTKGMMWSINIDLGELKKRVTFAHGDRLLCTPIMTPCVKNTWKILPASGGDRSWQPIRLGDCVSFVSTYGYPERKLFVDIPVPFPSLPVGKCGRVCARMSQFAGPNTKFLIVHPDKSCRYETEGDLVRPETPVVFLHASDHLPLSLEPDYGIESYFCQDCEISKFRKIDRAGRHHEDNQWSIIVGKRRPEVSGRVGCVMPVEEVQQTSPEATDTCEYTCN